MSSQTLVKNINTSTASSHPKILFADAERMLLSADDGALGRQIYQYEYASENLEILNGDTIPGDINNATPLFVDPPRIYYDYYKSGRTIIASTNWITKETTRLLEISGTGSGLGTTVGPYVKVGGALYLFVRQSSNKFTLYRVESNNTLMSVGEIPSEGNPSNIFPFNGSFLFTVYDPTDEVQRLMRWTNSLEVLLEKPAERFYDLTISNFVDYDEEVYFQVSSRSDGFRLFKTDGTVNGTTEITTDNQGMAAGAEGTMVVLDDYLYFSGGSGQNSTELWRTDGTEFEVISEIRPDHEPAQVRDLTVYDQKVFFLADDGIAGPQFWSFDPSSERTIKVTSLVIDTLSQLNPIGNVWNTGDRIYFTYRALDIGLELFYLEKGTTGATLVSDIFPGIGSSSVASLFPANDRVYFGANHPSTGIELWQSDGSPSGTMLVKDIGKKDAGSLPYRFEPLSDSSFLFWASNSQSGFEPWYSDGTESGTFQVEEINLGNGGSTPYAIEQTDSFLYFSAPDQSHLFHSKVYRFDKTDKTITPYTKRVVQQYFDIHNGTLYYSGKPIEDSHDSELYAWNPSTQSGTLVKDLKPDGLANPILPQISLGKYFFISALIDRNIWSSDGTTEGTNLIFNGTSRVHGVEFKDKLYFIAYRNIISTDGTADGNELIELGQDSRLVIDIKSIFVRGEELYFVSTNWKSSHLWKVSEEGTAAIICEIEGVANYKNDASVGEFILIPGYKNNVGHLWSVNLSDSSVQILAEMESGSKLLSLDDIVLFSGSSPTTGKELWKTDGTLAGTAIVADINLGPASSYPSDLTQVGDHIFFRAESASVGSELWKMHVDDCLLSPSTTIAEDLSNVTLKVRGSEIIGKSLINFASDVSFLPTIGSTLSYPFTVEKSSQFEVIISPCNEEP